MTHTPGPWKIMERTGKQGRNCHNTIPKRLTPVVVGPYSFGGEGPVAQLSARQEQEQDANAHLIAAAPELLVALQALVAKCWEQEVQGFGTLLTQAQAAITHAEGRDEEFTSHLPQKQAKIVARHSQELGQWK